MRTQLSRPCALVAMVVLAVSCASGSDDSEGTAATSTTSALSTVAVSSAPVEADDTLPGDDDAETAPTVAGPPTIPDDIGREIGFGAIGPVIANPEPWPVGTVFTDLEPGALVVDFVPPERGCIAGQATATIGRGGAVLVSVFVDGDRVTGAECDDSAAVNTITVPLSESLDGRRIYISTVPETGGGSADAELVADSVIGSSLDDATASIREAGLSIRVLDGGSVDSDFNPMRVNVEVMDGFVVFAAVF